MDREIDISNNFIIDLSNNINTNVNDTLTNILQNIYYQALGRSNTENLQQYESLLNNPDNMHFLLNNDNTLNNVFNDINPLLLNTNRGDNIFNISDIFTNLINNTVNTESSLNGVLNNSFNDDKSKFKKVLSDKGKTQLKKYLFKDSSKANNSCPIFHQEFNEEDEIVELPCKHCFIPEAIEKWLLEEHASCPVCRFELDNKEVRIKKNTNNENNEEVDSDDEEIDSDDEYEQFMQSAILESIRN